MNRWPHAIRALKIKEPRKQRIRLSVLVRIGPLFSAIVRHRPLLLSAAWLAFITTPTLTANSLAEPIGTDHCSLPAQSSAAAQHDRLHVTGDQLLNGDNEVFTPDGISVFGGLADGNHDQNWRAALSSSTAQIEAAPAWHANTVRIQVAEGNVFDDRTPGLGYNASFLEALCQQVRLARSEHERVVINDQTEYPDWAERNPTPRSITFWQLIAREYANQPGIIFDAFNEPRQFYKQAVSRHMDTRVEQNIALGQFNVAGGSALPSLPPIDANWVWKLWQRGGQAGGFHFIGMQQLIDSIRATGAQNVVEVEGPYFDDTLALAWKYPIEGSNLVWSIHHPPLDSVAEWDHTFGYLRTSRPVEIGEWSQFASARPECRPNAYTTAPRFLQYAHEHNEGIIGWSLQAGSMVAESGHDLPTNITYPHEPTKPSALLHPSQMHPDYACDTRHTGEGAGQMLLKYFTVYSRR